MNIEIWSDVVCPWCYIGKRRFESALEQFAHRDDVRVVWRSFELDPGSQKRSPGTLNELLARKLGRSTEQAAAMNAHVSALAAKEGLDYHLDQAQHGNTFDAHRLIHLAERHGLQAEAKERLLKAYFTEGTAIGDAEALAALAAELGLPADEVRDTLAGDAFADEVRADERRAQALGISGVPAFVINERYLISGAQEPQVLLNALEQIWAESHPLTPLATPAGAGMCDDESCAV